jgi:hypothetical protein
MIYSPDLSSEGVIDESLIKVVLRLEQLARTGLESRIQGLRVAA